MRLEGLKADSKYKGQQETQSRLCSTLLSIEGLKMARVLHCHVNPFLKLNMFFCDETETYAWCRGWNNCDVFSSKGMLPGHLPM